MTPPEDYCTCDEGSCGPEPRDKSFVPMVWGYDAGDMWWHDDINDPVDDKYDIILGFNEPNRPNRGADLTPEEAAAAWIELQNLYPDKVRNNDQKSNASNRFSFLDSC